MLLQPFTSQCGDEALSPKRIEARSTIGSAPDSKSGGWGFESLRACQTWVVVCEAEMSVGGVRPVDRRH